MLHRSALVAVAAVIALSAAGAAYPQAVNRNAERAAAAAPTAQLQRIGPNGTRTARLPAGPTVMYATTSLSCTNANGSVTTLTLSVNGGNCANGTITDAAGNTRPLGTAYCMNSTGDRTDASCSQGCKGSSGSGSCTSTTTPPQ